MDSSVSLPELAGEVLKLTLESHLDFLFLFFQGLI